MKQFRRETRPMVRGETCPASRTNKAYDPKVTDVRPDGTSNQVGKRACGRCGKIVAVSQPLRPEDRAPLAAWYYEAHIA